METNPSGPPVASIPQMGGDSAMEVGFALDVEVAAEDIETNPGLPTEAVIAVRP